MKYLKITFSIILLIISLFVIEKSVNAATPTPSSKSTTPSPKPSQNEVPKDSSELENIQKIKDIVASKVAELNLVEKRGIIGKITDVDGMKVVIQDLKGNSRYVDVDELTKFDFSDDKNAGISDLKKGESYSFVGIYNKDTQKLLARTIDSVNTIPVYFEGAISNVDKDSYQLKVVNEKGDEKKIDIQNSTKTSLATSDGDLTKSGYSKLEVNSRVIAIGFWDKKDKDLLAASRVIHFENIPPSKEMQSHIKTGN